MKAIIGYLVAGIGLLGLALNSAAVRSNLGFIDAIPSSYLLTISLIILGVGVVIMVITGKGKEGGSKIKLIDKEVPIYQGEGKNRKIVGYRAD